MSATPFGRAKDGRVGRFFISSQAIVTSRVASPASAPGPLPAAAFFAAASPSNHFSKVATPDSA